MYNSLFINENLDKGSHSEDALKGISETTNLIEAINYSDLYKLLGKYEFEEYIKKIIKKNNVELLFFGIGAGMIIDIFFIKELSENYQVKIIIGFPDSEHLFEDIDRYYGQTADLVWVNNPDIEQIFNVYNMPTFCGLGFDTNRYKVSNINKSIDVSFVGSLDIGNRKEYIEFLINNEINVEYAGYGSPRGIITTEKKNRLVSQSKINLNFTGVLNNHREREIYKRIKGSKGRAQEISLQGGFVLSEYASGLKEIFNFGDEIAVFHSKEELLDKVIYYLKKENVSERELMAHLSHERALKNHEVKDVIRRLLITLQKLPNQSNKTYYIDPNFARIFTSARFYYMVYSLLNGNFRSAKKELASIMLYKNLRFKNFYYDIPRAFYHYFRDLTFRNKAGFE
jgi:hypothetical protein